LSSSPKHEHPTHEAEKKDHFALSRDIAIFLEKTRLAEYMDLMQKPHRLAWLSFWGGIWRGFGFGLGAFVLVGAFFWFLRFALHHAGGLPWVGDEIKEMIGWLLEAIKERQKSL
jgi:hypothetical protein